MTTCPGCATAERIGLAPALCSVHLEEHRLSRSLEEVIARLPDGAKAREEYLKLTQPVKRMAPWQLMEVVSAHKTHTWTSAELHDFFDRLTRDTEILWYIESTDHQCRYKAGHDFGYAQGYDDGQQDERMDNSDEEDEDEDPDEEPDEEPEPPKGPHLVEPINPRTPQ